MITMKRKIIAQGLGGRTIFLPINWIRKYHLQPGDEIDIQEQSEALHITLPSPHKKKDKKAITLQINQETAVASRMIIVNAYRAGFDLIKLNYDGPRTLIEEIVSQHLIGFEITNSQKPYIIESVSEPSYDNCEKLLERIFFMISDILNTLPNPQLRDKVHKVQSYDNFIKRTIAKGIYTPQESLFLWQFLSQLAQIARICYHCNQDMLKMNREFNAIEKKIFSETKQMFSILQKSYLKKDLSNLQDLHTLEHKIVRNQGKKLLEQKSSVPLYHLMTLARMIYLSQSPLLGILEMRMFQDNKKQLEQI